MISAVRLVFIFFLGVVSLSALAPDCEYSFRFSNRSTDQTDSVTTFGSTGSTPALNNKLRCNSWAFSYDSEGFSVVSIVLQSAPSTQDFRSPGTFITFAGTTGVGTNPGTSTTSALYTVTGYNPFLRVTVTTATGTGSINVVLKGWVSPTMIAGTGGTGASAVGQLTDLAVANSSNTVMTVTVPTTPNILIGCDNVVNTINSGSYTITLGASSAAATSKAYLYFDCPTSAFVVSTSVAMTQGNVALSAGLSFGSAVATGFPLKSFPIAILNAGDDTVDRWDATNSITDQRAAYSTTTRLNCGTGLTCDSTSINVTPTSAGLTLAATPTSYWSYPLFGMSFDANGAVIAGSANQVTVICVVIPVTLNVGHILSKPSFAGGDTGHWAFAFYHESSAGANDACTTTGALFAASSTITGAASGAGQTATLSVVLTPGVYGFAYTGDSVTTQLAMIAGGTGGYANVVNQSIKHIFNANASTGTTTLVFPATIGSISSTASRPIVSVALEN